jgi:hypothetical protein
MDPGEYQLELHLDRRRCILPVTIDRPPTVFALDLATVPCEEEEASLR